MAGEFTVQTQSIVNVQITSSISDFPSEKRFQKDLTIGQLKSKLEVIVGSAAPAMELQLFSRDNQLIVVMSDDSALLGSYPVEDGMRIHVIDRDPSVSVGEYTDVSKVEKFELSTDDYAKRADTVREFKKKHKMGQFREITPEEQEREAAEKKQKEEEEEKKAQSIKVGERCEVNNPKLPPVKRGLVMYVGKTDFQAGYWVGVKYDEPVGKNDGSVKGKRYFECEPKYGGFNKPEYITTGDFPEEDLDMDLDEM
ncbi:tubulin-folding cofactor B-like [Amphiura filiformis]|uniref:tubulin-folding cofactor B-like n=1 Tax=Amphiura filiformis TaxID=82378 RepID=UPI003B21DA91